MSSINTNLSAMTALQALKATQTAMNKNQNQISTGLRVGEASHNASYWSIATSMKSDNGALGAVKDSIKQSKAMINTYTSAMDKSLTYLNKMKEGLVAASQPGADLQKIQTEFNANIEGMKSAAGSASFNGQNWLAGAGGVVNLVTSYDGVNNKVGTLAIDTSKTVLFEDAGKGTGGILSDVAKIDIGTVGAPAKGGHAELAVTTFAADDTISFKIGTGPTQTFTVGASATTQEDVRDAINQAVSAGTLSGVNASVVDGKLRLESTDVTKTVNNLGYTDDDTPANDVDGTSAVGTDPVKAGAAAAGYIEIDVADLAAGKLSVKVGDGEAQDVTLAAGDIADVDALKTAVQAAIDGETLLGVSASVVDGKLRLTSTDVTKNVSTTNTDASDVTTDVGEATAAIKASTVVADGLKAIDEAIAKVTEGSAMLGANKALLETQEEFIGVLSDSLTAGVSAFVDADMNEASTRNQALQTQQQLGVQALSMANQNSQMILRLFQ
ncbi:flagellin [Microvirga solisilvae]|uniref:flagellin n=1 Tax=Microvirga solisilvae TaxID=2919498 RepID=UPI001FAF2136|nr:flagellin [Microvirga solisilvae]